MNFQGTDSEDDGTGFWNLIYTKYSEAIFAISGVITLLFVGLLIVCVIKYNFAVSNAHERKGVLTAMLWIIGAIALFGGTTLILGISFNIFL